MSRQYDGLVGKDIQFGSNGLQQLILVAIGKVESPDTPLEQHIAPKNEPWGMVFQQKDHVPDRVPWRLQDLEIETGG